MWLQLCAGRHIVVLGIVALCGAVLGAPASAQSIDLSLNLYYSNPLDDLSGGTWQVVAKSGGSAGIAALDLRLAGIVTPPAQQQPVGPRGTVNAADPAGFSLFEPFTNSLPTGVVGLVVGQVPVTRTLGIGEEQSIFYGVGTIENGQPGDVGPALSSLTNPQAIPWATGDPFGEMDWNTAAVLAAGMFNPGQTPSFYADFMHFTSGSVFTAAGTSMTVGPQMVIESVSTIVRDNLGASPDYNGNGVVDAADYTLWRDTRGMVGVGLAADGNLNGVVDQPDYDFWKLHFGLVIPPGGGSGSLAAGPGAASAVPEPAAGTLLFGALGILFLRHRCRHLRNVPLR